MRCSCGAEARRSQGFFSPSQVIHGWQMFGLPEGLGDPWKSLKMAGKWLSKDDRKNHEHKWQWRLSILMFHYQMLLPSPVPRQSGFVQKLCMISPKCQFWRKVKMMMILMMKHHKPWQALFSAHDKAIWPLVYLQYGPKTDRSDRSKTKWPRFGMDLHIRIFERTLWAHRSSPSKFFFWMQPEKQACEYFRIPSCKGFRRSKCKSQYTLAVAAWATNWTTHLCEDQKM